MGFPSGSVIKKISLPMQEMEVWSLGHKDPLEKEVAIHCSSLAWEIPWTGEPGGLVHGVPRSRTWLSHSTTTGKACCFVYFL